MCDTVVVVRPEGVLFAKNSDRDPNEAQLLEWHPARRHAPGSEVRCTWIAIPQVPETHAVLLSRPFWMWGAEIGANAHGVTIGNEAVFTRRPYARSGLTGMDLLRLALERAASAREAVEVIGLLLHAHGQGGGCGHENRSFTYHNSFIVADPREAFVVETAGRELASERVQGARSISNGLTLPGFAEKHADRLRGRVAQCDARRQLTEASAGAATSAASMMAILRQHGGEAWPRYAFATGTLASPCMHGGGTIASSHTTASWVADLRPGAIRHWVTATGAPCLGLFKPVAVDQPVDLGASPTDRADPASLWWAHESLHRLVMRDPERLAPLFLAERDELEARWLGQAPSSEEAFSTARQRLTDWSKRVEHAWHRTGRRDARPFWARRYWASRDRRAGR